jgi:hypothetical protein
MHCGYVIKTFKNKNCGFQNVHLDMNVFSTIPDFRREKKLLSFAEQPPYCVAQVRKSAFIFYLSFFAEL